MFPNLVTDTLSVYGESVQDESVTIIASRIRIRDKLKEKLNHESRT